MKSDLSKVKVGDSIWTIQEGWTEVKDNKNNAYYPIRTEYNCYTLDGKSSTDDQHPSAFLTNPFVDEAFIKEAYSEACPKWQSKLKEKFPEVFKSGLEVGKWYKSTIADALYFIKEQTKNGFNTYGLVGGEWCIDEITHYLDKFELATESEIKEALINEAKKRGFKEGVKFKDQDGDIQSAYGNIDFENINGETFKNIITFGRGNGLIFWDGTWAEIIPTVTELTLEQIADKFGVDVNTLKIKK